MASRLPIFVRRQGQSQDFLNQPTIRAAAGLLAQPPEAAEEVDIEGVPIHLIGGGAEEVHGVDPDPEGAPIHPDGGGAEEADGAPGGDPDPVTQPPPQLPAHLPSMDDLHSTMVPTLKWCPKAARGDFAREQASLWFRLAQNPDEVKLWQLESMFVRCILPAGRGP